MTCVDYQPVSSINIRCQNCGETHWNIKSEEENDGEDLESLEEWDGGEDEIVE